MFLIKGSKLLITTLNDFRTNYDAAEINEWYNGFIEVGGEKCRIEKIGEM